MFERRECKCSHQCSDNLQSLDTRDGWCNFGTCTLCDEESVSSMKPSLKQVRGRQRERWRGEESERWWRLWNNLCGREGGRRFCTAYTVITSFYSWQRGRGHKPGVTRGKAKIRVHQTWQSTAGGTQDIRAVALGGGRDLLYTSLVPQLLDKSFFL